MRPRHSLAAGLAGFALVLPLSLQAQEQANATAPLPAAPPAAQPDASVAPPAPQANAAPTFEKAGKPLARVRVVGPYLDMRTAPGRGYPVTYAAEKDEWVVIELRHTDWFKVRTARGPAGWVSREQMKQTVTEDGVPFELADPTLQDYLNRRFDFGLGYGATSRTSFTRGWAGWRFSDTLSLDFNGAAVQGRTYTANLWTLSLLSEPWSDRRLSPFFGVGVGRYHYEPNESLVNAKEVDNNLGALTLGTRYFLSGRVAVRFDYSRYAVFKSEKTYRNYQAGTVGLSIHF